MNIPSSGDALILLPVGITLVSAVLGLWLLDRGLRMRYRDKIGFEFRRQMIMLSASLVAMIALLIMLPVSEQLRGQLLSLLGILLSAAIAFSSTTFISNMMAGIMLRAVRSFRAGDFLEIEGHFGRVSEIGLLHTEIQTEDRDLKTLPNLFLATHPYRVVKRDGTIVSASVSLGYDVPSQLAEECLKAAAAAVPLQDPFVQVSELGDFSVSYRVAGLLSEVKHLLTTRSKLRAEMLQALHSADIEVVSPNFMNTRAVAAGQRFIPAAYVARRTGKVEKTAETVAFDKADDAQSLDQLREQFSALEVTIEQAQEQLKAADTAEAQAEITKTVERQAAAAARLMERIKRVEAEQE